MATADCIRLPGDDHTRLQPLPVCWQVQLFHCLDYHAGLAPVYLEAWGEEPIPTCLTLHNALYQGSLMETLDAGTWSAIEKSLQLPHVRRYADFDGDFNMLHAVVEFMRHHQKGEGITGVSNRYGREIATEIPLFKGIFVGGHPNPMLEKARPVIPDNVDLLEHKRLCKV